jgi:hypothetical protein
MPVGFNESQIAKLSATQKAAEGKHALMITVAERHNSENNDHIMAVLTWKILEDPENANSTTGLPIRTWLTFPLNNLSVDGHEAPEYSGNMACNLLSAIYPEEVFAFPRVERGTGQMIYRGEVIDRDTERSCRHEAVKSCVDKSIELWGEEGEGLAALVCERVFAELFYKKDSPDFPSLRNYHTECPGDWVLSDVYVTNDAEDNPVSKKKTKKKATKKKAKKKTSRR